MSLIIQCLYRSKGAQMVNAANQKARNVGLKNERLSPDDIGKLLRASRFRCAYCGKLCVGFWRSPDALSLDHLICFALGGHNVINNVSICCRVCNLKKNKMPFSAWLKKAHIDAAEFEEQRQRIFIQAFGHPPTAEE